MICAERVVRREGEPNRAIYRRELLDRQYIVHVPETGAAVLHGHDHSEQPHLTQALDGRHRKLARFIPGHNIRSNLTRGKGSNLTPEMLLLLCQHERIQTLYDVLLIDLQTSRHSQPQSSASEISIRLCVSYGAKDSDIENQ